MDSQTGSGHRDFPSHFLNQSERIAIADARREGSGVRAIARVIGRSPSTISREITRNSHPIRATYSPHAAQERAQARKPRPKVGKIAANLLLARYIQQRLALRFSPEQIHHRLKADFPHD